MAAVASLTQSKASSVEERRTWVREPVDQSAIVLTSSGVQLDASISDFCPGGMFLRPKSRGHSAEFAALLQDQDLKVFFKTPYAKQRYHVSGQVKRASSVGAGLSFGKPHKAFYRVMHRVAMSQRPEEPAQSVTRFDRQRLLTKLARRAEVTMTVLMEEFVTAAEIRLIQRSHEEFQDEDQAALNEAVALTRALRRALITIVPIAVARGLRTPILSAPVDTANEMLDDSPLHLVDGSHFDHWITVSELAAKGESRFPVELFELRHRLGLLYGEAVDRDTNPVSPLNVVQAFARALDTLPLSVMALHSMYSCFDKKVINGLGRLYDSLNQELISAGVAPVVSHGMPNWMPDA